MVLHPSPIVLAGAVSCSYVALQGYLQTLSFLLSYFSTFFSYQPCEYFIILYFNISDLSEISYISSFGFWWNPKRFSVALCSNCKLDEHKRVSSSTILLLTKPRGRRKSQLFELLSDCWIPFTSLSSHMVFQFGSPRAIERCYEAYLDSAFSPSREKAPYITLMHASLCVC